jgi:hypothetical protein
MKITLIRLPALLAGLLAVAPAVLAQEPGRIANVYDGTHHEPAPGAVHREEKSAGIAPSADQQRQENNAVEQEANKLIAKSQRDVGASAAVAR